MPGRRQGIYREWRVGVIVGGLSAEREVSLMTGREVVKALRGRGYQVISVEAKRDLPLRLCRHRVEVVFNALHGKMGEDGCVQGLLEVMGLPYTGSGVTASALSMDKVSAKGLFVRKGISTPPYQVLQKGHGPAEVRKYPFFLYAFAGTEWRWFSMPCTERLEKMVASKVFWR